MNSTDQLDQMRESLRELTADYVAQVQELAKISQAQPIEAARSRSLMLSTAMELLASGKPATLVVSSMPPEALPDLITFAATFQLGMYIARLKKHIKDAEAAQAQTEGAKGP